MILTTLEEVGLYTSLATRMPQALTWLRAFDPAVYPDGRHEILSERVFALVSSYETAPATEKRFEAHRRHIDVQYVASGVERILHTPANGLEVETPYDEENDILFFADPKASSSLLVPAGGIAIFHPNDAHKPGCMAGASDAVRKVVVKVRI